MDKLLGQNIDHCSHCLAPTSFESNSKSDPEEGEICLHCGDWVCNGCIDWKHPTKEIICKKCSNVNMIV